MKRFSIYLLRWILSGFVMLPFMMLFEALGLELAYNIILGQLIGACIFYKLDSLIFTKLD
jgi:hypothetical protein